MKIKLSKSQWELIGKTAGWIKTANISISEIIQSIKENRNQYFSYKHFCSENMSDYTLMQSTVNDLADVYGISEEDAADIVQSLTHGDESQTGERLSDISTSYGEDGDIHG